MGREGIDAHGEGIREHLVLGDGVLEQLHVVFAVGGEERRRGGREGLGEELRESKERRRRGAMYTFHCAEK